MTRPAWHPIGPTVNGRTLVQHAETGVYALAVANRRDGALFAVDQHQGARMARELSAQSTVQSEPINERD
jgi:hypothetical protein